jgi:glycosyltransferase involved in cell wall biosynthesis
MSGRNCAHTSTQRNDPFRDYPMLFGFLTGSIIARIHKKILLKIPTIVSCSYSLEEANALRGIPCSTIQNGIETDDSFVVPHATKITRRVQLGLPQDKLLFICVAPLIHRKNIVNLIRTFGEVRNAQTRHLILLGDGPLLTRARSLAAEFKNISVIGHVENVDEHLQASDCLLSASRSEGLPNSVIEALAWGLPVILSDIPAHRELHRIEPNAGSLFALQDHLALAQLIEDFERSERTAYAARSIATDSLNARIMANRYQDLYQSLAHTSIKHQ